MTTIVPARRRVVACPGCPFGGRREPVPDDVMAEVRRRIEAGEAWVCHETCDGPQVTDRSSLCALAPAPGAPA